MNTQELVTTIKQYIPFAVLQDDIKDAEKLLSKYDDNLMILRLLYNYYTNLPDAFEEAVIQVSELITKNDVHLFVLVCKQHNWLYAVTIDNIILIGEYGDSTKDIPIELIQFFDYGSQKEFFKKCPKTEKLQEYCVENKERCPACGVVEGENHLLGCVVEICPWCDGQLHSCNCRFEKLDLDEIENEDQLEEFTELLEAKGRIAYSKGQYPAYPGTSEGLDSKDTE